MSISNFPMMEMKHPFQIFENLGLIFWLEFLEIYFINSKEKQMNNTTKQQALNKIRKLQEEVLEIQSSCNKQVAHKVREIKLTERYIIDTFDTNYVLNCDLLKDTRYQYIGKTFVSKTNEVYTVIDITSETISVKFSGYNDIHTYTYRTPRNGQVFKNYTKPRVYGVGFIGLRYIDHQVNPFVHKRWKGLLSRCYGERKDISNPATCCEEWHSLEVFEDWFLPLANKAGFDWHIDKDLDGSGRHYSPDTVHYIPENVNHAITFANTWMENLMVGKNTTKSRSNIQKTFDLIQQSLVENEHLYEERTLTKLQEYCNKLKIYLE